MYETMHDYEHTDSHEDNDSSHDEAAHAEARDRHGLRGLAIGLLLGAVIGAGTALLMAPQSGLVTRKKLRRSARRLANRGGSAVSDWWEDTDRSARQYARRGIKQGRKAMERMRG